MLAVPIAAAGLQSATGPIEGVSVGCDLCRVSVDALNFFLQGKPSQDCFGAIIEYGCETFDIEDDRVCLGIQSEFKDEFLYVISTIFVEPREICSLLFSNCGSPYNPLNANWSIPIPPNKPPVQPWTLPKPNAPTLRVLHLSDIHFDPDYLPGSEADCAEPLCCRKGVPAGKNKIDAGYWGTPLKCDMPEHTLRAIFEYINANYKFDVIYWTGDLPPHDVWSQSRSDQLGVLDKLTEWFTQYFPGKLIVSAVGNHESTPVDSYPQAFVPQKYSNAWLYDKLEEQWLKFGVNANQSSIIKYRASYSIKPFHGLKIISVNTMGGDDYNLLVHSTGRKDYINVFVEQHRKTFIMNTYSWLYMNETDPDGTLNWLKNELLSAEKAEEKVHIIGHVPPGRIGSPKEMPQWSLSFYNLVNRFENTIRGMFYGHTHLDQFEVFYENGKYPGRATSIAYVAPSITTYSYLTPSFRIYTMDGNYPGSTFQVLDTETYTLDLDYMNAQKKIKIDLDYEAKQEYSMASLTPTDWSDLIERFKKSPALFQTYYKHLRRNPKHRSSHPDPRQTLCDMRMGKTVGEPDLCSDLTPSPQYEDANIIAMKKKNTLLKYSRHSVMNQFDSIRHVIEQCRKG